MTVGGVIGLVVDWKVVLERVREMVAPLTRRVGLVLARIVPDPDFYTFLGAVLAWLVPIAAVLDARFAPLMLVVSALFDAVDGAVARVLNRVSVRGEFLDSTLDRLADSAYFYSLYLLGVRPDPLIIGGMLAVVVSYVRAKGELVGVRLRGVGLMERGDRIIVILVIMLLSIYGYKTWADAIAWIMALLIGVTVIQRSGKIISMLEKPVPG